MFLVGNNVSLRPLESEDDVRYLFRVFNNPEANDIFVRFEPRSWDEFQKFLKDVAASPTQFTVFLIEKKDDKRIIGSVIHFIASAYYRNLRDRIRYRQFSESWQGLRCRGGQPSFGLPLSDKKFGADSSHYKRREHSFTEVD